MLATKKPYRHTGGWVAGGLLLLAVIALLAGCTPPGPRALLQGETLVREAKYPEAIAKLKVATQLLPREARAWNYLGMAYHGDGQVTNALIAYHRALTLDRDLMTVHYNLGCLWLEQDQPNAAIDELNSFVTHPRYAKDINGWTKLGTALMRAKRWDEAAKVFNYARQGLGANSPEVLNNLGVIDVQRKRLADAATYFGAALTQQSDYGPALLNLATLYERQPNTRPLALRKYREYLALNPRPDNWNAVAKLAQDLDNELTRPPTPPLETNLVTQTSQHSNQPDAQTVPDHTPPPKSAEVASAAKPPAAPEATHPKPAPPKEAPTPKPTPAKRASARPAKEPAEEATQTSIPRKTAEAGTSSRTSEPAPAKPKPEQLAIRLAPARTATTAPVPRPTPTVARSEQPVSPPRSRRAVALRSANPVRSVPIKRYHYLSPARPAPGDRAAAEKYFAEGLRIQQDGQQTQAMGFYQKATELDPTFFAAYYNLALAAGAQQYWQPALTACEFALALKPDSVDARYQLAVTLRQAGYPYDAAKELQTLLKTDSNKTRLHLALANLYAQQLDQPTLAREQYLKVLADAPNLPQALQIRQWLATHP